MHSYSDVMRDNMIVNLSGLEGDFMAIDLNIEHLTRFLKVSQVNLIAQAISTTVEKRFFAAKGVYANWDHLVDISATVGLFQHVRQQVGSSLGISYHGLNVTPDTDASVQNVAYRVNEFAMHVVTPGRKENTRIKPVIDALAAGERKLKSSTLATFNRKVQALLVGQCVEDEEDEIPPASFDPTDDDSVMEGLNTV